MTPHDMARERCANFIDGGCIFDAARRPPGRRLRPGADAGAMHVLREGRPPAGGPDAAIRRSAQPVSGCRKEPRREELRFAGALDGERPAVSMRQGEGGPTSLLPGMRRETPARTRPRPGAEAPAGSGSPGVTLLAFAESMMTRVFERVLTPPGAMALGRVSGA